MTKIPNPWTWIPTLYFAQGFPYIIINGVSVVMYKNLGVTNSEIAFYTSWLYLPWVIKPLWSPIVELKSSKRNWFLTTQLLGAISFGLIGFLFELDGFFLSTLIILWLAAFSSATHDIAADGYYMLALSEKDQSFFIGIRSTFYRLSVILGQGGVIILAGLLFERFGNYSSAWSLTMYVVGGTMFLLWLANLKLTPPQVKELAKSDGNSFREVFISFFRKKHIGVGLTFMLTYRLGESQLVKMASPFFLDDLSVGGLGLSTTQVGTFYGTFGWVALSIGGVLGGYLISQDGLGRWILPMAISLNLPNLLYVYLSYVPDIAIAWIATTIVIEQFGYGFGFSAYLLFMIYMAEGTSKTAHYALMTGFMALGMMLPGLISGWIQEWLGYPGFFVWVVVAGIPGIMIIRYLEFPKSFGLKTSE